jgi:endonuclease/exonuclease/phosphatase family metal-dependent hydrolase
MIRVLSYNILVGGKNRVDQLTSVIASCQPDVVGLVEAIDEQVVEQLAHNLGMEYRLSGRSKDEEAWQGAVLSRFPIVSTTTYLNAIITKQPLLEVGIEGPDGEALTVFVTHLTAAFSKLLIANNKRRREIQELLRIMESKRGTKHLVMGDFNSIAPGEQLRGSSFLRYTTDPSLYYQLKPDPSINAPDLNFVLPPALRMLKRPLEKVPRSKLLCNIIDACSLFYAPRSGFRLLCRAGYMDCFRATNPDQNGFTWPAPIPAGRVDYIFASSELASSLTSARVVVGDGNVRVQEGSDHLPVFAEFSN